jgi:hypothetical protein
LTTLIINKKCGRQLHGSTVDRSQNRLPTSFQVAAPRIAYVNAHFEPVSFTLLIFFLIWSVSYIIKQFR